MLPPEDLSSNQIEDTVKWLEWELQSRIAIEGIPTNVNHIDIRHGRLWLEAPNMFSLSLTLSHQQGMFCWRLLSVDVLIEDKLNVNAKEARKFVH